MKPIKSYSFIAILLFINNSYGQAVEGYFFDNYKIAVNTIDKKAELNYSSNPIAKTFKTRITEGYRSGKIDFAGHFITILWGCGTSCISGVMVDVRDGNIYDLPIDEFTAYIGCYQNDEDLDNERINYLPNSKLLITMSCSQTEIENSPNLKQEKTYYINIWDDIKKKFVSKKQIKRTVVTKR